MSDVVKSAFLENDKFIVFEDGRIYKRLDPPVTETGYQLVTIEKKTCSLHREAAGMTQRELAEKLGVDASTVCYWEKGKNTPSVKTLMKIAGILGVPPGDLITG